MNRINEDEDLTKHSFAERITFSIALLILGFIVGLVVYIWADEQNQQPPTIAAFLGDKIRESSRQFYVPFSVTNTSGSTAESVQIIAELRVKGQVLQSSEQQIDFLSNGETEEGAFIFNTDPRQGELVIRAASYKLP
jgi:uncharacterized protein (TIGR02588 family)